MLTKNYWIETLQAAQIVMVSASIMIKEEASSPPKCVRLHNEIRFSNTEQDPEM